MGSSSVLLWAVLFGSIGTGYFVYGKRQSALVPLLCGLALIVLPWIVDGSWTLAIVGLLLVALPFVLRN